MIIRSPTVDVEIIGLTEIVEKKKPMQNTST